MGGLRGIKHYMQRTAIQGHPTTLTAITQQHQPGSARPESEVHLFRKHFEDLNAGDTVTTARHTVTEADIVNFANVSGDHFYAHVDETSLEGTMFRRASGTWVLHFHKAAGLFVEPRKGPVLLNYGIDECRFTKPVYPGTTIGVKLTVVEKIAQERREPDDVAKGIVRYRVEVDDHEGDIVAWHHPDHGQETRPRSRWSYEISDSGRRSMAGRCFCLLMLSAVLTWVRPNDLDSLDSWVRQMQPDRHSRAVNRRGCALG